MIEERITHIESANGRISLDQLGATLMHEHLVMAFAGWEGDSLVPTKKKAELVSICVDKIAELQDGGFSSLLDPCPIDIGRDVELYGEVAARTGFNILFATGIYNEHFSAAYWRFKLGFASDAVEHLAEMYIREITEGLGGAKLKPAVIKLAIGLDPNSAYEEKLIQAAVIACKETNTPILTHTDGVGGDILINKLVARGIPAHRVIIGHCCGSPDKDYHRRIVEGGAYIGFDRFGLEMLQSDDVRIEGLHQLLKDGYARQVVVSHDCAFCQQGRAVPDSALHTDAMHFSRTIVPRLRGMGIDQNTLDSLLTDNPYRYFSGEEFY